MFIACRSMNAHVDAYKLYRMKKKHLLSVLIPVYVYIKLLYRTQLYDYHSY